MWRLSCPKLSHNAWCIPNATYHWHPYQAQQKNYLFQDWSNKGFLSNYYQPRWCMLNRGNYPIWSVWIFTTAQSFQRHIDYVLSELNFVRPYLNDILIFSNDKRFHSDHLHTVFQHLSDNNLLINSKNCEYFSPEVRFLEYSISAGGRETQHNKLKPLPRTVTNLRSFLGAVNFYHKFIPVASSLLSPLSVLSVGQKSSTDPWIDTVKSNFAHVKEVRSKLVTLKFYDHMIELQLTTDASNFAIGSVLQ